MSEQTQTVEERKSAIELEPETHSLFIRDTNRRVQLSKTEYRIFQALFCETLLSEEQLATEVFACFPDKSIKECLDKHIDHLRRKIRSHKWRVYRVLHYRYILLQEHSLQM
jgi:DNA-binding response OmpR family regulator